MPAIGQIVHPRFAAAIGQIYSDAVPRVDYALDDVGNGPVLTAWSYAQAIPTDAQITAALVQVDWALFRIRRDVRLAVSQWLVDRHRDQVALGMTTSLTTQQFAALLTWRQQLRDLPQVNAAADPNSLALPAPPVAL